MEEIPDALTRGSAWVDLWENVLEAPGAGTVPGSEFLDLATRALPKESDEQNGGIKPERLDVLEFGRKVAFEIVFDDEDVKEIRIAAGAEDVPGKCRDTESDDGRRMKEAQSIGPSLRKQGPAENRAARKDYRCGPFRKNREP